MISQVWGARSNFLWTISGRFANDVLKFEKKGLGRGPALIPLSELVAQNGYETWGVTNFMKHRGLLNYQFTVGTPKVVSLFLC